MRRRAQRRAALANIQCPSPLAGHSLFRPLAVNVGLRYARSKRSFLSFVSGMALAGLALSVAVLLFVQALAHGFQRELEERLLGVVPHFTLFGRDAITDADASMAKLRAAPEVRNAAAIVVGAAMVSSGTRLAGVQLKGVAPDEYRRVIGGHLATGSLEALQGGAFRVLLGHGVMERLEVETGDAVTLVLPDVTVTPFGAFARRKTFRVAGRVRTHSQLDGRIAFLHLEDAQTLFRLGNAIHGIEAWTERPMRAEQAGIRLRDALGAKRFVLTTWFRTLGPLHRTIEVTKGTMFLVFSILVAVAAFNVVSSLVMIVNERRADVAILRTIGARASLITGAFLVLGFLITSLGAGLGLLLGLALGALAEAGYGWAQDAWGLDLMRQYLVHRLPVEFAAQDVIRVAVAAAALGLCATLYPAWRAARMRPAEALRHE